MQISATITSEFNLHKTLVSTDGSAKELQIPPKASGFGSSVNGAEFLLLSLATCYCNDLYREAAGRNIPISGVDVECKAEFGAAGEPGFRFSYMARVRSDAPAEVIEELIRHTDQVAEIQKTLRKGVEIQFTGLSGWTSANDFR